MKAIRVLLISLLLILSSGVTWGQEMQRILLPRQGTRVVIRYWDYTAEKHNYIIKERGPLYVPVIEEDMTLVTKPTTERMKYVGQEISKAITGRLADLEYKVLPPESAEGFTIQVNVALYRESENQWTGGYHNWFLITTTKMITPDGSVMGEPIWLAMMGHPNIWDSWEGAFEKKFIPTLVRKWSNN